MAYVTSWERIAKKEGRQEGRLEGRQEEKLDTAQNLLKDGVDIDIIARATGLTRKELEQLARTTH